MSGTEGRRRERHDTTRTAAAISGIFFFHSTSSLCLRDWFDNKTTENLYVSIDIQYLPTTSVRDNNNDTGSGGRGEGGSK